MSSRAQHYRQAERILADIADFDEKGVWAAGARERALNEAEIRAHLANVSDETYNEYLDLLSLEAMREEVAGTPPPDSRDWLKDDDI